MDAFSTELAKVLSWYCDSIETVKSSEFSNRKIAIDGSNYFIQQKESKSWCLLKALSNAILMQSREVEACYVFEKESDKGTEQKEDDDEDRMQKCDKIKELLSLFGFPVIQSLSSTPAECAALVHGGQVYASAGQWLECLAHGSKYNVLDLDFLGGKIEVVQLDVILEELRITYMQFIDLCIIVGNKYGEGIIGIGPRRAYEWIVEFQNIETIIKQMDKEQITIPSNWPYQAIRDKFLHPVVNKNLKLMWKKPDVAGIVQFLSNEHNTKKDQTVSELKRMLDEPSITSKMKSLMSRVLRALSSSNSNPDKQFSTEILEEPSPVERSYSCSFNCRRDNLSGFFLRIKCRDKCNFILHKECFESSMKEQGYLKKKFYKGAKCPTDGCTALFNDIQELGKTTTKSYFMDKCKTEKKPPVDNKTKKRQDKYLKKWKKIDQEIDQGNNPVKTDSAETAFMENTKYETHELGSSTRLAPSTLHEEVIKLVKPTTNIELKYKVSCKNQEQLRKRNLKKNLPVHISDLQRRATTVEQTGSLMLGTKEDKEKYGWACDAYAVTPFAAFLKELDETEDRDGRRDRRGGFGDRGGGGGYGDRGGGFGGRGGYGGGGGGNGDRRRSSPRRRF